MAGVHGRPTKEFFAHWEKILAEVKVVPRVIEVDGEIAGSISCFERDGKDFVGYWLGRAYWGRGGGSDRGHCRCCWKR